jgi:uncharacterized membrane protein YdjX (TVP38/TMEM64 family)
MSTSFGLKQMLILLGVVGISVAIIVFGNQILALQRFGYIGVFLIMLLGNMTIFVPVPILAPLNVILGGALPNPLLVGLAAGLGSSLGELSGYLAGYSGSTIVKTNKTYLRIKEKVVKHGLFMIFLLALIPNPLFDVGGLAAGAIGIKWWKFLIATIIGKTIRTIIFAYIGYASLTNVLN